MNGLNGYFTALAGFVAIVTCFCLATCDQKPSSPKSAYDPPDQVGHGTVVVFTAPHADKFHANLVGFLRDHPTLRMTDLRELDGREDSNKSSYRFLVVLEDKIACSENTHPFPPPATEPVQPPTLQGNR